MRLYRGDDLPSVWAGYFFGMHISTVIMVSARSVICYSVTVMVVGDRCVMLSGPVVWYAVAVMIMRDRCIMLSRSVVCYSVTVMVVGDMGMFVFARGE